MDINALYVMRNNVRDNLGHLCNSIVNGDVCPMIAIEAKKLQDTGWTNSFKIVYDEIHEQAMRFVADYLL